MCDIKLSPLCLNLLIADIIFVERFSYHGLFLSGTSD
jgi:hypothetical protein